MKYREVTKRDFFFFSTTRATYFFFFSHRLVGKDFLGKEFLSFHVIGATFPPSFFSKIVVGGRRENGSFVNWMPFFTNISPLPNQQTVVCKMEAQMEYDDY